MGARMTREQAAAAVAAALDALHDAYWAACDNEGRAIEPTDLGAPEALLDEAFDAALQVQGIAEGRGISWTEARDFV
jgi:hypothetical protein